MTVKIVRMLNGEDVIADVQEAYPDQETYSPIGYMLTNPYQIEISDSQNALFRVNTVTGDIDRIKKSNISKVDLNN